MVDSWLIKCLPLQWFLCSSQWVSSLEIKLIRGLVQRYYRCCWPGVLSFPRPLCNCILEYKWVYSLKKIFHLNSSQLNFFFRLHHLVFTQSIHKLNSVLWLCKVSSCMGFCHIILTLLYNVHSVGLKARWSKVNSNACVMCKVKSCITLQWYWNCKFRVPNLHSCGSDQNKIGSKLQVGTISDHPESLRLSIAGVMLPGGGSYYERGQKSLEMLDCCLCHITVLWFWKPHVINLQKFRRETSTT